MRPLRHSRLVSVACAAIGILLLAASAHCQDRWYKASLIAVGASQAADVASSWGGIEANPVLGAGQRYGYRATSIKLGIVGAGLLIQRYVLRRHPEHRRAVAIVNFAMAGTTTGVAVRNWRIR